jgi:hypothetical protein
MVAVVIFIILSVSGSTPAVVQDAQQDIPELTGETVVSLLLFEIPDLARDDIQIVEIRQLEEMGRAHLIIRSREEHLSLVCRMTDFGPRWRFEGQLPAWLTGAEETGVGSAQRDQDISGQNEGESETGDETPIEHQEPESVESSNAPAVSYKGFIAHVLSTVRSGDEAEFAGFFFQDSDFDYASVESEGADPVAELASRRESFVSQCVYLSERLQKYEEVAIATYVAKRGSRSDLSRARLILPRARRYIKSVSIEVMLDGEIGKITFEGLVLLDQGWRVGNIAAMELP